jgi:ABC-2 type transport system permease protein
MLLRLVVATALAQVRMTRRNIEDLHPLLTNPLITLVSMAVVLHAGRADLAGWALVASALMTIGGMSVLVASEVLSRDRYGQTLELAVASPAPYFLTLLVRILLLTTISLVGFVEGWLIARVVFGVHVAIYHPWVLSVTLLLTILAASGTSLVTSALFCFGRTTRTFQNTITGPLYLLGGVLVPTTFLPDWLEPASRLVFFFWSANLLRASLLPADPQGVLVGLVAIAVLAIVSGVVGAVIMRRMLDHLRREGRLGLS